MCVFMHNMNVHIVHARLLISILMVSLLMCFTNIEHIHIQSSTNARTHPSYSRTPVPSPKGQHWRLCLRYKHMCLSFSVRVCNLNCSIKLYIYILGDFARLFNVYLTFFSLFFFFVRSKLEERHLIPERKVGEPGIHSHKLKSAFKSDSSFFLLRIV